MSKPRSKGARARHLGAGAALGVLTLLAPFSVLARASSSAPPSHRRPAVLSTTKAAARCPWATAAATKRYSPAQLARQVLNRMTLSEKIGLVDLSFVNGNENENSAVARLCIPTFTLQDGPDGLGYGDTGVTQLPASIATAATFDPRIAYRYGVVLGQEAHTQGIDAVQGPNLNLARVPESGRLFETYGEDPVLSAVLGAAEIEGIQASDAMAVAKHFTAYTQETARFGLNQVISERALQEVDMAPFRAAVQIANVAGIMCAYGQINGQLVCQDRQLLNDLKKEYGFSGFIRSDNGAVDNPVTAFDSGLDLIKPVATASLIEAVSSGALPLKRINDAVSRVLTEMFAFGFIERPSTGVIGTNAATSAHRAVALVTAERSIVLLKDRAEVLPLRTKGRSSLAVIGADASSAPMSAGAGGAYVTPAFVVSPLAAIVRAAHGKTRVIYAPALSPALVHELFPGALDLTSPSGAPAAPVSPAVETASAPLGGAGWEQSSFSFTAPVQSIYQFALTTGGDTWLSMNGVSLLSESGLQSVTTLSHAVHLSPGATYSFVLSYFIEPGESLPRVTVQDIGPAIAQAVGAARATRVAVVFANDNEQEGVDRQTLALPGYQDALINAVSAVNHHTIVVLNTGGAVLMPWLARVAGVLEAWYPGEEDGAAISAVLFGKVDPSGHLPITFPVSDAETTTAPLSEWPGVNDTVSIARGLDIGYRGYEAAKLPTLFPFGFGLSYTYFSLSDLRVSRDGAGYAVTVQVSDTGQRAGREVLQSYLAFPGGSGEPLRQLEAFGAITLKPGSTGRLKMEVPANAFEAFRGGHWKPVSGHYRVLVGESSNNLPLRAVLTRT